MKLTWRFQVLSLGVGAATAAFGALAGSPGRGAPVLWVSDTDADRVFLLGEGLRPLVEIEVARPLRLEAATRGGVWILRQEAGRRGPSAEILHAAADGTCTSALSCREVLDLDADPEGRLYLLVREAVDPVRLLELEPPGRIGRFLAPFPGAQAVAAGEGCVLVATREELFVIDVGVPPAVIARSAHAASVVAVASTERGFWTLERRAGESIARLLSPALHTLDLRRVGDATVLKGGRTTVPSIDLALEGERAWALSEEPSSRLDPGFPLPSALVDLLARGRRLFAAELGAVLELGERGEIVNLRGGFRGLSSLAPAR